MSKKLILSGRVQKVGCRQYCSSYGKELSIKGSATNRPDGTVEVLLDTEDDDTVKRFVRALMDNPMGYLFFGRITDIRTDDYKGPLRGDYLF